MEDMIRKRLQIISDLQNELRSLKENYEDLLENDSLHQEMQEKAEEVKEERKAVKTRMMNSNDTYVGLQNEMKDKRVDIKENKEALSQELVELYRQEGKMEITDSEGNVQRMKFNVRLVSS